MSAPVILPPNLSPSLGEYDNAVITDAYGNKIPLVANVHPSLIDGTNELSGLTVVPGVVSQVTGKRGQPQVSVSGVLIPIQAVVNIGAGPALSKAGGKFQSTVQTGTGSSQSIAHGLGAVPSLVLASVYNSDSIDTWTVVEGVHTSTNLLLTVTSGVQYKVIAFV